VLISLIVCTRNRCSSLRDCLEYVRRLESPGDWELVIVDNASTDQTADLLKTFVENIPFGVRLVFEPIPGLGRARNAGVAKASGEIIAFTDDDCYVSSDFLIRILEVFRDARIDFMGGRILLHDETDVPLTIRPETEVGLIPPRSFVRPGQLQGANMAARRALVTRMGGFDPDFGAGSPFRSCEETDFQARASQAGATGIYHPGPLVWHHHGRKPGKDYKKLMNAYHYGCGAYYAKFILNRETRSRFLKNWYWSARNRLRDHEPLAILKELAGASAYILLKLRRLGKALGRVEEPTRMASL
jgi:glycosyltransferase involved in cell wall biosynthesis